MATNSSSMAGHREISIPGNILLGGLFPIFVPDKEGKCSVNSALGVPQLEALLYSMDLVNKNTSFLTNVTVGVRAFDTCGSETAALNRAVKGFVLGKEFHLGHQSATKKKHVVGVIGPGYSYEAVYVSPFLGVFNIPITSYAATSPNLSDKAKYEYFSRTIPSDSQQAMVILELLRHFKWTYVSLVYSDEQYGRNGFVIITDNGHEYGICFSKKTKLSHKDPDEVYREAARHILDDKKANTVVMFCVESVIPRFMMEMRRQARGRYLQFIGSETLAMLKKWSEVHDLATSVIFTLPATNIVPDFVDYFYNLSIDNNIRNPWFKNYFEDAANCSFGNSRDTSLRKCNSSLKLSDIEHDLDVGVFNTVSFVIDAVFSLVNSLDIVMKEDCEPYDSPNCDIDGEKLLRTLRSTPVRSPTGTFVNISVTGDVQGGYNIYYLDEFQPGYFKAKKIGERLEKLNIFPGEHAFMDVESHCWQACKENEIRKRVPGKKCCSWCFPCREKQFALNESFCQECEQGYYADLTRKMCVASPLLYISIDDKLVPLALVLPPLILSCIMIVAIFFTLLVFFRYNNTPLVKASARELSYLLLLGLFLSSLFPFMSIARPSQFVCVLQFVFDSVPFTVCLVAIAVKNNRTHRIFNVNRTLPTPPLLINPRAQMTISTILVILQLFLVTLISVSEVPNTKLLYPSSNEVHLTCSITMKQRYLAHVYNVLLLFACTYYAYKTRNIPRNFNEARYISFAMYGSCVIFFAFLIVSLTTDESRKRASYQPTFTSYRIVLTEAILFANFFLPKVYIILWRPEQNKKHSMMTDTLAVASASVPDTTPTNRCQHLTSTRLLSDTVKEIQDKAIQTD